MTHRDFCVPECLSPFNPNSIGNETQMMSRFGDYLYRTGKNPNLIFIISFYPCFDSQFRTLVHSFGNSTKSHPF